MPIANNNNGSAGDRLPVVTKGERLQTWLNRAVPALMRVDGNLTEQDAVRLAQEAWSMVNGGDMLAGQSQQGQQQQGKPALDQLQGKPQQEQQKPAQRQQQPAKQPAKQQDQEQQKQTPPKQQAQDGQARQQPQQRPDGQQREQGDEPQPRQQQPAKPQSEQEQQNPAQHEKQPAQQRQQPEQQDEGDAQSPDQPQQEMSWDQSTWGSGTDLEDEAQQAMEHQPAQADSQQDQQPGEARGNMDYQADGHGLTSYGEEAEIGEWYANRVLEFAQALGDHLLGNGVIDSDQFQHMMAAMQEVSPAMSQNLSQRLAGPADAGFTFNVSLPSAGQFGKGGRGSGYHGPHVGLPGVWGGSAPRGGGGSSAGGGRNDRAGDKKPAQAAPKKEPAAPKPQFWTQEAQQYFDNVVSKREKVNGKYPVSENEAIRLKDDFQHSEDFADRNVDGPAGAQVRQEAYQHYVDKGEFFEVVDDPSTLDPQPDERRDKNGVVHWGGAKETAPASQFETDEPFSDPDMDTLIEDGQMDRSATYPAPHFGRPGQAGGSMNREEGYKQKLPELREKWDKNDRTMFSRLLRDEGFSYQPVTDNSPATGYALSPYPDRERVIPVGRLNPDSIEQYMRDNEDMWNKPNHYFGAWFNTEDNKVYLDVSVIADSPEQAAQLSMQHKQEAYYDIAAGETVYVRARDDYDKKAATVALWAATKTVAGPEFPYVAKFPRKGDAVLDQLAIKSLGRNRVGNYLVVWGDQKHRDLSGEFFTPQTQELTSIFDAIGTIPAIYHHALDNTVKSAVVGLVDRMEMDDTGLWIEAQVREHQAYKQFIKPLVDQRLLGWSSGALPGGRQVNKSTGEILRWPIVEASMTPTPMEWRMAAQWPVQNIKAVYQQAGLPFNVVTEALRPQPQQRNQRIDDLARERELIALLELS